MKSQGTRPRTQIAVLCCILAFFSCGKADDAQRPSPEELLSRAGNTESERERYELLTQLRARIGFESPYRVGLDRLLPVIDRWANGREKYWKPGDGSRLAENGYLCGFFARRALSVLPPVVDRGSLLYPIWRLVRFYIEDVRPVYPPEIGPRSPLYPIWCMYRGRMLISQLIQSAGFARNKALKEAYFGEGRRLLRIAAEAFPQNRVIRMYLDEPVPWPPLNAPDPGAPEWANLQREGLEKLADIVAFWIDERQAPDGQFGGGWGDDVEMWRKWVPILIGFEDEKVRTAQARLCNGLFALKRMAGGYTNIMGDVEHTGEDSGDAGTAMMHIDPDNPVWKARARRLAELMRDLWTGRNRRGFLQFKSINFTSQEVSASPRRAYDTAYHPRAVQPALLYWQRTGDPELTELFGAWMDTWVDAAAREERGKPAGVLPSAIHWPDGRAGGKGKRWWNPGGGPYRWPRGMERMTCTLLLTSHMTGDQKYLEPIKSMAALRTAYLESPPENPVPGSAMWCAGNMRGKLSEALGKYRLLTGDRQFDPLLLSDAGGYVKFRLTGNREPLVEALRRTAEGFGVNRAAYTGEVRWTDRVFAFDKNYANHYADPPLPRPSPNLLYRTVTGDFGNPTYFPMNAVRWKTPPRDIAALVTDHSTTHLSADLYHFGEEPRPMGAELYLLGSGEYEWMLGAEGAELAQGRFEVTGPRTVVWFELPSRRLCSFRVRLRQREEQTGGQGEGQTR